MCKTHHQVRGSELVLNARWGGGAVGGAEWNVRHQWGCFGGMHPQPTPTRTAGSEGLERAAVALEWLVSASASLGRPQRWLGLLPSQQEKEE